MRDGVDAIDRALANALQEDARLTNAELGRRVGLAPSSVHERVRRLEEAGYIEGYHARLNHRLFGADVTAFVFVDAGEIRDEAALAEALKGIAGVESIYHIAGEDCFLVKLRSAGTDALGRVLRRDFGEAGARSTRTTLVLETVVDRPGVPVEDGVSVEEVA